MDGGAFESVYVIYTIEILAFKSSASRRYSDFVWLREVFSTLPPGYPLPPVAKKGNFSLLQFRYEKKAEVSVVRDGRRLEVHGADARDGELLRGCLARRRVRRQTAGRNDRCTGLPRIGQEGHGRKQIPIHQL
jgi:hypothetical protein